MEGLDSHFIALFSQLSFSSLFSFPKVVSFHQELYPVIYLALVRVDPFNYLELYIF